MYSTGHREMAVQDFLTIKELRKMIEEHKLKVSNLELQVLETFMGVVIALVSVNFM